MNSPGAGMTLETAQRLRAHLNSVNEPKKPHLRRESGHWLCTESRKERNIMRGTLGDTPCQAFYYFIYRQNMETLRTSWDAANKSVYPGYMPFFCT